MLDKIKEENILFIDIEIVAQKPSYDLLDDHHQTIAVAGAFHSRFHTD